MTKDMTEGRPLGIILRFALPMLTGAVFQQFYNIVDMLVVGNAVGSRALAAIGATGSATFFATALMMGLTTGFTTVVSQQFGAKNAPMLRNAFTSAIYISMGCVMILAVAGVFGAKPLMRLLQTPDDIIADASLYLQICIGGSVGMVLYNGATSVLRAVGDSRTPLIFLIITSLMNVVLDLLLVFAFSMGVAGAAIATVISQCLSAVACLVYMYKRFDMFRLAITHFRPHLQTIGLILKIGLPISFQSLLLAVGDMTITGVVNTFGTDVVAAFATGNRIMMFSMMFCMNLAQAFAVFAGQNLGAGEVDRIKQGFYNTKVLMAILSVIMTGSVFLFGDTFVRFFISNADTHIDSVVSIARNNLRISASFYIFLGLIWLYNFTLRGIGDVVVPFVSGLLELVIKVGLSIALSRWLGYIGIWFAAPIGWVVGLIPSAIRFHTGGWKKLSGLKRS